MYLRWKNKEEINKKEINSMTLIDKKKYNEKEINNNKETLREVFYSIMPTNTYPGWLRNNLKLYRALQYHPENKMLKRMFMDGHLNLFAMKRRWKFARSILKSQRER